MTGIFVFAAFYILCFLLGSWADVVAAKLQRGCSLLFRIASGGCILIGACMIICSVCALLKTPVTVCAALLAVTIAVLAAFGLIARNRSDIRKERMTTLSGGTAFIVAVVSVVIVILQIYGVMSYAFEDVKVMEQIASATKVFESGRLFISDPMMLVIGSVAGVFGIHPLLIVYSILPATLISFYYVCCAAYIAEFTDVNKRFTAFIAVSLINLFGYQSRILIGATLLLSWSGTGVFVLFGLAPVAAVCVAAYQNAAPAKTRQERIEYDEDVSEEWDMKKHRIINARNLAIALGVLAVLLLGTIVVLNSKINSLYAATVNLQDDLNSRVAMYEFVPDGGEVAGYLIKGSDGTLSFVGGGAAANADELGEFIGKFGNALSRWYVYGTDEESSGAMRELTSKGIVSVEKIYVISTSELAD